MKQPRDTKDILDILRPVIIKHKGATKAAREIFPEGTDEKVIKNYSANLNNILNKDNNRPSEEVVARLVAGFPDELPSLDEIYFVQDSEPAKPVVSKPQSLDPGPHSDGYNPLKEAYEQLMERVRMLESYNEDLREDKKHLQEDKKRLERKNTALLKKMGVPVDEESFNEAGLSSLSVVHRNMQIASKQGA